MLSTRKAATLSPRKRRFLLFYGSGIILLFAVFMALTLSLDARTKSRQEDIFNKQQATQAMLARQAIEEHFSTARKASQILVDHSLPEFVRGDRDEESTIRLYKTAESRIPSLLSIAFLETPVYFATHASDYSRFAPDAQRLGVDWGREYWDAIISQGGDVFVPPFSVTETMQAMGMLFPVHVHGEFKGVFVVVVDMGPAIARYVEPLRSGNAGAAFLLDGEGTVVFDHEPGVIGQNVLKGIHDSFPELLAFDKRVLSERSGISSYSFTTHRGGPVVRKLAAWDSLDIGGRRLVVVMSAPDIEIDTVLGNLRTERAVLTLILLTVLLITGVAAYRRTEQQESTAARHQILDLIEFLPDPTFAVDSEGRIIAWNQALAVMTGVARNEMLGKGNREYAVPFYGERRRGLIDLIGVNGDAAKDNYCKIEAGERTLCAETFVPKLYGGKGAHVWATASLLLDDQGRAVGAIECIRDITDRIEAERALRASEERFALAVAGANDGIWDLDLINGDVYFSARWKEIIGYKDHEIANVTEEWTSRIHPDDWNTIMEANNSVAEGRATHFATEYRLRHKDGSYRWVLGRGAGLRDATGRTVRMSGAHTDVTERKDSETISRIMLDISSAVSTTHDLSDLYAAVHEILTLHIGAENFLIALVDTDRDIIDFAYARDPHHGLPWEPVPISSLEGGSLTLQVYEHGEPLLLNKEQQIAMRVRGEPAEVWCGVPLRIRDKTIGVMAVQDYTDPTRYTEKDLALLTSVSEQVALAIERKMYEEQIRHQALHDSLTGLPNRTLFMDRLERAMRRQTRREGYHFAVLMMDLDRFKLVNDSHGHAVGDHLLVKAAQRIQPVLRSVDTLARLGGDEFAVLLEEFDKPQQVIHIVRRIQEAVALPMLIDDHEIRTTSSTGIVIRTEHYASPEEILRDSDIAMYQAKRQGKGLFRVFNASMHDQAVLAMTLESDMAMAMANHDFHLHFQPIFHAADLRLAGFEALLRWDHARRGSIAPSEFIPLAEETGLIIPLGQWVLEEACAQMAAWRERLPNCRELFLTVNLSARQASQSSIVRVVRQALAQTGLPPEALKLELTETAVMEDPHASLDRLERLNRLGVGLAIDDFGTGHSSLAYLSRFPVDTLKVDNSFVRGLSNHPENLEIIRSIVALAETLDLLVVAEGVEDATQLEAVRSLGCKAVQGFHLGRPMPPDQAESLLTSC